MLPLAPTQDWSPPGHLAYFGLALGHLPDIASPRLVRRKVFQNSFVCTCGSHERALELADAAAVNATPRARVQWRQSSPAVPPPVSSARRTSTE